MMRSLRIALLFALALSAGCKTIPADSYGVHRLRFHGVDDLDDAALRACLATRERSAFQIDLGTSSELDCNVPPFDGGRLPVRLVTWPWEEWPTFDEAVFERDLDRVERWYRARGYYDARVERAEFDPPSAGASDELPQAGETQCDRRSPTEGCPLDIDVYVTEGEPVLVRNVTVSGAESLHSRERNRIRGAVDLDPGDRFDEALHDLAKVQMVTAMREVGYACAEVQGQVDLDPELRIADVSYAVRPGPMSKFREVRVEVQGDARGIPLDVIRAVSALERGMRYAPSRITSAQRDVYALGAFSAVEVEAVPIRRGGEEAATFRDCTGDVDVVIHVTPGRRMRYGVGAGIDSGQLTYLSAGTSTTNVPQWNVHLVARFEHRNLFGGLRRLRIEDRPKITFQDSFPNIRPPPVTPGAPIADPSPGNELSFDFRQPAFIERATTLTVAGRWDLGPDPIYGGNRHLFDMGASVQRSFVQGHLSATVGVYGNSYQIISRPNVPLGEYTVAFFRQMLVVDYRDNVQSARRGFMFSVDVNQAGPAGLSTWSYIRVMPEVRAFIPLPARLTIAARFLMGATYIYKHPSEAFRAEDPRSYALGPSPYRLRGGGPNSHRGFAAGRLGDRDPDTTDDIDYTALDGGLAKWEASLEIRARITDSFAAVLFADAGDVSRKLAFRFNRPNIALGFGIRYYTVVGPLRLDFGFLPRGLQYFGPGATQTVDTPDFINGRRVQGSISITIGEAF